MLNKIEKPITTYRQLGEMIAQMSEEQLDSDITVHDAIEDEIFKAELRIVNGEVEDRLDDNHPIIWIL